MHLRVLTVLSLISSLLSPSFATANEERIYDVEVVVFSHKSNQYFSSEEWDSEELPTYVSPDNLADFTTSNYPAKFKRRSLPSDETTEIIEDIKKSSRYDLIAFQRWRQPGLSKDQAIPVKISSNLQFEYDQTNSLDLEDSVGFSEISTPSTETVTLLSPQLDGHVTIELGRFLHIYTDLIFTSPIKRTIERIPYSVPSTQTLTTDTTTDQQEETEELYTEIIKSELAYTSHFIATQDNEEDKQTISLKPPYNVEKFAMKSHRKTRSKQFQYIDHPLFGLIVKITPVES